jgi:hypothetical protein
MYNFLEHELAIGMALKIYNEIAAIIGHPNKKEVPATITSSSASTVVATSANLFGEPVGTTRTKRPYSKRKYNYKLFYVRIFDKKGQCVFERTNNFRTKMEAKTYAIGIIAEIKMGSKSRIEISKF